MTTTAPQGAPSAEELAQIERRVKTAEERFGDNPIVRDLRALLSALAGSDRPIPMVLFCPNCGEQHIDEPDQRTPDWTNPPHRSHLCHGCGHIWRPADVATVGVRAISTRGKADSETPATPIAARLTWLARDNDALLALMAGRLSSDTERLPLRDGDQMPTSLAMVCRQFVAAFDDVPEAKNYLQWGWAMPDGRSFVAVVQRADGKTPADLRAEAEAESARLVALVRDLDAPARRARREDEIRRLAQKRRTDTVYVFLSFRGIHRCEVGGRHQLPMAVGEGPTPEAAVDACYRELLAQLGLAAEEVADVAG